LYLRIKGRRPNAQFQEAIMTTSDVNRFRRVLEATVIELDSSMRRRDGIIIEASADELDRVLGATERELVIHTLEVVSAKRRAARAALRRIDEGSYGTCVECEETISPARLAAMPAAALCIHCQEAMDCGCGAKNSRAAHAMAA
jgi:DnaK suppressor protein